MTRRHRATLSNLEWVEKKRGGRRAGAGRPKSEVEMEIVKVSIATDLWAHAKQFGGQDLIRELLEQHRRQFNSRSQSPEEPTDETDHPD